MINKATKRAEIQERLARDFTRLWLLAKGDLEKTGIRVHAVVLGREGKTYRITRIAPAIYTFGDELTLNVPCYGIQLRANGTWGTHEHWAGWPEDITPITV